LTESAKAQRQPDGLSPCPEPECAAQTSAIVR
jgi:hypothetical protein